MPGIEKEILTFLAAVLAGASVRLAYRCLSCLREIIPHSSAAIGAEDLLFWTGAAIYIFMQIYHTSSGSIRWYFVLGVVAGAVLMNFFIRKMQKFKKNFYITNKGKSIAKP